MRLTIAACILAIVTVALLSVQTLSKSAVGLYAPDRYDGIPDMCLMPMDFGYCRAKVKRYYFDMRRMKCTMFYWGGCAGNNNNFKSIEECNKLCSDAIDEQHYNYNNDNANAPASLYTPNTSRNSPTQNKKFYSNSIPVNTNNANAPIHANPAKRISSTNNVNANNGSSGINTALYANQNFNKFKVNRSFNVPKTVRDPIDLVEQEEDEDYEEEK